MVLCCSASSSGKTHEEQPRMLDLVNDAFRRVLPESLDACMNELGSHGDTHAEHGEDNNSENNSREDIKAKKLRDDATQPLYPSCGVEETKLSVIVELVGLKSTHNWSNNSFDELLKTLKRVLPSGNTLAESTTDCLEMIKSLGMNYISIHACPNDCMLYWKDNKALKRCTTCGEGRYKAEFNNKSSLVPKKVLRYFPLTPRLRRLYSIPWIAEMMTWHSKSASPPGYMRHPSDSSCWRGIDTASPEFAAEPRNVRLGLSTDGFNPFGNKSLSHSCWPVMIVPYNLPPSFCMLKEFTMLSLLIPGKHSPGKNIDVYLEPLVDELKDLWNNGSTVFDSHSKTSFTMKAVLLWTIQDFPAYGYLSGCRTSGKYACPVCGEDISSIRLKHGSKQAYMGHRCFLPDNHPFRSQKSQFNGKEEHGKTPKRLTGDKVLEKVKNLQNVFGKVASRKRKKREDDDETAWSKRSILFELPYWELLVVRNNLDVMHVEKNVAENLIGTIMGAKNKTNKDGLAARLDLKEMNIRKKLWPVQNGTRTFLPHAPFLLSREEKMLFCQTLKTLKVPIGYSSNWVYNVSMEELQIRCPKSHDYHIVIQQLLPVLLMYAYKEQKPLGAAIRQLSIFFNVLCSKVICRKELEIASRQIVEVLCVFEKYFPPSFFVSMTHLVVHLAEEARICGPVRFRWMYPFERMMRTFKTYVRNKRFPEGCIAERYLIEESILYCNEYMPEGGSGSHKRARKNFLDDDNGCSSEQLSGKKGKVYKLSNIQYEQVRRWVLECSKDVVSWREKYHSYEQNHPSKKRGRKGKSVGKVMDFIPWLREQLENEEMSPLKRLAEGPLFKAMSYNRYTVNGYQFCTAKCDSTKTTQNSGVAMNATTSFRASARDKNLIDGDATYYGVVQQILELDYTEFKQVVFLCDWVRIGDKVNGCSVDPETRLTFVNFRRFMSSSKEGDEPFILASQARQVFYCKDPKRDDWRVVLDAPKKLTRDVDAYEDPLVFEARLKADAFRSTLVDEVVEEDICEGSWVES